MSEPDEADVAVAEPIVTTQIRAQSEDRRLDQTRASPPTMSSSSTTRSIRSST